jgi:hypothetical protein
MMGHIGALYILCYRNPILYSRTPFFLLSSSRPVPEAPSSHSRRRNAVSRVSVARPPLTLLRSEWTDDQHLCHGDFLVKPFNSMVHYTLLSNESISVSFV